MSDQQQQAVGFIGLGIMGLPMCKNLIKAGRRVVVWNRTVETSAALAADNADGVVTVAATAADVIAQCALTYSMLSTLEASEAVSKVPKDSPASTRLCQRLGHEVCVPLPLSSGSAIFV